MSTDNFFVVPCICENGYEGELCETDIDACAAGPCHPEVICTDVPASQLNNEPFPFKCDACPPGMIGDGRTCAGLHKFNLTLCLFFESRILNSQTYKFSVNQRIHVEIEHKYSLEIV